jgi:hypothetical protein
MSTRVQYWVSKRITSCRQRSQYYKLKISFKIVVKTVLHFEILGFHVSEAVDRGSLDCEFMWSCRWLQTFRTSNDNITSC